MLICWHLTAMFPLRFCLSVPFSFPTQAQHVLWSCIFSWSIELRACLFSQCFCKTRCSILPFTASLRDSLLLGRYTLPSHSFPLWFQINTLVNKIGFCFTSKNTFFSMFLQATRSSCPTNILMGPTASLVPEIKKGTPGEWLGAELAQRWICIQLLRCR